MSKKSKIVAIGSMLFVFSILFIEVLLPIFEIEYIEDFIPKDFISVISFIGMSFSLMIISFGSSFFFMEFFVREKTVFRGRPITGLFSLCTALLIIIGPQINVFCNQSTYTIANTMLCLLFGVVAIVLIASTVVLISKVACFFMIKKGYDRSSIIVYLIVGTLVSSTNYSFLLSSRKGGEGGVAHVFVGMLLTIIALIANAKTIAGVKKK